MVICEKYNLGDLCFDCKHSIKHERYNTCIGSRCYNYSIQFGKENSSCNVCKYRDDCFVPEQGKTLLPLRDGERCPEYRNRVVFAKCIEIKA